MFLMPEHGNWNALPNREISGSQLAGRIVYGRSPPETGTLTLETRTSALTSFSCKSAHPDFIQIRS